LILPDGVIGWETQSYVDTIQMLVNLLMLYGRCFYR